MSQVWENIEENHFILLYSGLVSELFFPQQLRSNLPPPSPHPPTNGNVNIQNVCNFIPIKLTRENYLLWKSLFLPILRSFDVIDYIDGTTPCPSQYLPIEVGQSTANINPAYTA